MSLLPPGRRPPTKALLPCRSLKDINIAGRPKMGTPACGELGKPCKHELDTVSAQAGTSPHYLLPSTEPQVVSAWPSNKIEGSTKHENIHAFRKIITHQNFKR